MTITTRCVLVLLLAQARTHSGITGFADAQMMSFPGVLDAGQESGEHEMEALWQQPPTFSTSNAEAIALAVGGRPLSVRDAPGVGNESAPIIMIEFCDFECPFCSSYNRDVFPRIKRTYIEAGLLRYVFRHFPLRAIHERTAGPAIAAECAWRQHRFWEMHDFLLQNQRALAPGDVASYAADIGLDITAFRSCANSSALARVMTDKLEGARLSVRTTPTFMIGVAEPGGSVRVTRVISGVHPFQVFEAMIGSLTKDE